jgi:hypothetical protein
MVPSSESKKGVEDGLKSVTVDDRSIFSNFDRKRRMAELSGRDERSRSLYGLKTLLCGILRGTDG